jgi:hypothetical protein
MTNEYTKIPDDKLGKILARGFPERYKTEDISVRFRLATEIGGYSDPCSQEDIGSINLPSYIPSNLLKCNKYYWSEAPHDYYHVEGTIYLDRNSITMGGVEVSDFVRTINEKSGEEVLFRGKKTKLNVSWDSLLRRF